MSTPSPVLEPQVRGWLRLEGLAAFAAGVVAYASLGGDWLWFVPALLAVDVSLAGYLRGPRIGALVYNVAHQWATALAVLGVGIAAQLPLLSLTGAVLVAHTGMDRTLGYGLKLTSAFTDTHLGRIGRARAARIAAGTTAQGGAER
jgi:hypothetical protein